MNTPTSADIRAVAKSIDGLARAIRQFGETATEQARIANELALASFQAVDVDGRRLAHEAPYIMGLLRDVEKTVLPADETPAAAE